MFAEGLRSGTESGVPAAAAGGPWITPCACSGVSTHQCQELVTRGTVFVYYKGPAGVYSVTATAVMQHQTSDKMVRRCLRGEHGPRLNLYMHLLLNPPSPLAADVLAASVFTPRCVAWSVPWLD